MKISSPHTTFAGSKSTFSRFHLMCGVGLLLGVIQASLLIHALSLSFYLLLILFTTSAISFLILGLVTKMFTGRESHVMLRNFILLLVVNFCVLRLCNQPALVGLDILAAGYGMIILFGRIGCLYAGCCHGRPASFGVRYSKQHVKNGLPEYYYGIPLLPVQIFESLGMVLIIASSVALIAAGSPPGIGLVNFTLLYCAMRFVLEFLRGDKDRPYVLFMSEAQWTTLFISAIVLLIGTFGGITISGWHSVLACAVIATFLVTIVIMNIDRDHRITLPDHVREILAITSSEAINVKVISTTQGFHISSAQLQTGRSYTISRPAQISKRGIRKIAGILSLRHETITPQIIKSQGGVWHIVYTGS